MKRISELAWEKEGREKFGDKKVKWFFVCPKCDNIQSVVSVFDAHNNVDPLEVMKWIFQECEGKHFHGMGCNFSLIDNPNAKHSLEVITNEGTKSVFEFLDID